MPQIAVFYDPYSGLAESAVTSNVVDLRDAFDARLSVRTISGTVAGITLQVSNHTGGLHGSEVAEESWSNFTSISPSAATIVALPLGVRWFRSLRTASGASLALELNKQVMTR